MVTRANTPNNRSRKFDDYTNKTAESILAKIDAGIRDADAGRFATDDQVQAEFVRWRGNNQGER